jgi:hypothetical protein
LVFSGFWRHSKLKNLNFGKLVSIISFSVPMHQTTVLPYKMHMLGFKKRHAKFSPARVFSSIRVPNKNSKQKNNPVWNTYATKMSIHCIFKRFCEHSVSKTPQGFPFSFKIVSYFFPH